MLAGWKKDELGIGMPYHLLEQVIEGLKSTVNPLERNREKEQITLRMEEKGLSGQLDIVMNKNYDDGCYTGGSVGKPGKDE